MSSIGLGQGRKACTLTSKSRYGSSLLGAVLCPFLTWCLAMSIPYEHRNGVQHDGVENGRDDELTILLLPDLLIGDRAKRLREGVAEELASWAR